MTSIRIGENKTCLVFCAWFKVEDAAGKHVGHHDIEDVFAMAARPW